MSFGGMIMNFTRRSQEVLGLIPTTKNGGIRLGHGGHAPKPIGKPPVSVGGGNNLGLIPLLRKRKEAVLKRDALKNRVVTDEEIAETTLPAEKISDRWTSHKANGEYTAHQKNVVKRFILDTRDEHRAMWDEHIELLDKRIAEVHKNELNLDD
jgi:hypothetical protein